ncbi:acyl-CoA N-acyltransferase, partial [Aulographum hederae CBS 113979]
IRIYHPLDALSISHHANDPAIARYMTDAFPSPYTVASAESWIKVATAGEPEGYMHFALIDARADMGIAVGGIGLKPGVDVQRFGAEVGYWLGRAYWGSGAMVEILKAFTTYAFTRSTWPTISRFNRLYALVFNGHTASEKTLQRAGFSFEGSMRGAI